MQPPTAIKMDGPGQGNAAGAPATINGMFQPHDAISVQQTMRGCFQEMCGCEAKSEYRVFAGHLENGQARQEGIPQIGHLLEESSCLMRFCCGSMRAFNMPLTLGTPGPNGEYGQKVVQYHKACSFPLFFNIPIPVSSDTVANVTCPCCCLLPKVETITPDGQKLGHSQYVCDIRCLVPKYDVVDKAGNLQYKGISLLQTPVSACKPVFLRVKRFRLGGWQSLPKHAVEVAAFCASAAVLELGRYMFLS
jgi:hypothetical protein